jgi:phosphoglycerate dehydrogenase-like enzyme
VAERKVVLAWDAKRWELRIFEERLKGLAIVVAASGSRLLEEIVDAEAAVGRLPDEAVMAACRLKFVQAPWAGVDGFNLELLRSKGVVLASAKGCNARAVAEHALALMLALAKRIAQLSERVKSGGWVPWSEETFLDDLEGKTVVIVGYGNIGRELARMCRCLGMRVIGVRRRRPAEPDEYAERVVGLSELGEVAGEADFLVVALPLTPETRGAVGRRVLKAMKPTAYLVNVGRGAVVDEEALYEALTKGWIAGAALDVWWSYPPDPSAPSRLGVHKLPNVVATPHKAGWTREARRRCLEFAAENVARYLRGEEPLNVVDYSNPY